MEHRAHVQDAHGVLPGADGAAASRDASHHAAFVDMVS
jgi:hypothetical protein